MFVTVDLKAIFHTGGVGMSRLCHCNIFHINVCSGTLFIVTVPKTAENSKYGWCVRILHSTKKNSMLGPATFYSENRPVALPCHVRGIVDT